MNELISQSIVLFDLDVSSKEEAIRKMASAMDADGRLLDKEAYTADVFKREESASTAVGFSIATPHAKSDGVKTPSLGFMRFNKPFAWDENSEDVSMAFMIGVPVDGGEQHLEILAKIFRNLIHDEFREKLTNAKSADEVVEVVNSL